jgi:hypothetical protein
LRFKSWRRGKEIEARLHLSHGTVQAIIENRGWHITFK